MRNLVALLAGLLVAAPLCAIEVKDGVITLDASEQKACAAGGGCLVASRDVLKKGV